MTEEFKKQIETEARQALPACCLQEYKTRCFL